MSSSPAAEQVVVCLGDIVRYWLVIIVRMYALLKARRVVGGTVLDLTSLKVKSVRLGNSERMPGENGVLIDFWGAGNDQSCQETVNNFSYCSDVGGYVQ